MRPENVTMFSKRKFLCGYCQKKRKGSYRYSDNVRSCEKCNRAYDYVPKMIFTECPLCKGAGHLVAGKER